MSHEEVKLMMVISVSHYTHLPQELLTLWPAATLLKAANAS